MITFAVHQVRAGLAGASEDFEQMLGLLVRATCGEANLVFANPGDWGIDVLVGDLGGRVTVWQAKYFARGVSRSQRDQINASFASALKAAADHGYALERWVLCIPASMDGPTLQWWQAWKARQQQGSGVAIELWDETGLRELLLRPAAGDVRRHYYNSYRHDVADAPATVSFPYRGLSAFAEQDAGLFFGREAATARVLEMMSACRGGAGLLVVSGVSGAGKSSLMQAGVLPRLRDVGLASVPEAASWPRLVFTPGRDPLGELSVRIAPLVGADAAAVRHQVAADPAGFALTVRQAALTAPAEQAAGARQRRVLLVIDQCEQIFTLCQAQERQAFITALHAAATADNAGQGPAAMVVLVIRADFEAALADFPQLSAAVQDRYLLTAMTMRQLRLAITRPATAAGSRADDDLVQVLLEEVRARASGPAPGSAVAGAGVLPLLSHALDQAWRTRAGQVLTLADYERTGGIEGAVALSAQRAYEGLTPAQRDVARQLFTRLTATTSDGTDTAARATRADLTAGKDAAQARDVGMVVETFAAQRLLTLGAETVEISHEALLTAWPLLREWLSGTHADRIIRTRLHATTQEWVRSGRDPSYLYDGSRLEAAVEAAARIGADVRHAPLSPAENEFLHASRHASRRRSRRRRGFTAVLLALVSALAATTVVAFRAGQEAAGQRDAALSGLLSSKSLASSDGNATASATESIIAWALDPSSAQARYAMLAAAARPQIATLTAAAGTRGADSVAFSADGRTLAVGTRQGTAELWDLATLRQVGEPLVAGSGNTLESVTFSPDGKMLATGGADGSVRLWDVAAGRQIGRRLTATNHEAAGSVFSPDGKMLAIASANTVQLWNVGTGQPIGRPFGAKVGPVAFSPDGKLLATGGDNAVQLWNVSTRREIGAALTSTASGVFALAFSPDGTTLAAGFASSQGAFYNGAVQLWNVSANRRIGDPLTDNAGAVTCMAFSPDGTTLVTGSYGGAVQLWNTAARELIGYPLAGSAGAVSSLAFSPDGATLASATADGAARLWNVSLATGSQIGSPLVAGTAPARIVLGIQVAFSPDGKTLAAGSNGVLTSGSGGTLWNVAGHRETGRIIGPGINAITTMTFSPDGEDLAAGYSDGTVRLWNTVTSQQTGPPLADATSSTGAVEAEAFSPDGTTLDTVGSDGNDARHSRVRLWNVAAHKETGSFVLADFFGTSAFAPGGSTMAFGGTTLQLWNVATHHSTSLSYSGSVGVISSLAFSPDRKILAVGGENDTVQLLDVTTSKQKYSPLIGGTVDIIQSMAFSPDGTILAVGSGNGSVQLWNLATSQRIGTPLIPIGAHLIAGFGENSSTTFSPDGKILAVGYGDGTVRLWDVGYLVDTLRRLCTQIGGSLTRTEWAQYVPQGPAYRNVCP